MEGEIELYKKREEHRRKAREKLPPDLQLEFPQQRPEKEKWSFEGELLKKLLKLRHSQEPEDELFVKWLRSEIKKKLNKEITEEERLEIKNLQKITKEKRETQSIYLESVIIAKEAMERCFAGGLYGEAGSIAIELAKLGQIKIAENAMETLFDVDMYSHASKIAIELAKLEGVEEKKEMIEIAENAMEIYFAEGWYGHASKIAIELAKLGEKPKRIIEILDKHNIEEKEYSYQIVAYLLKTNEDLGKLFLKYLPQFKAFKEYGKEINQQLPQEKKTDNPEEFFKKYQIELAKLHFLDLKLSNGFSSQTLKNHGFPRLERYFENVVRWFNPEPLKEPLAKVKDLDPEYFSRLIEISSAYQRMGLEEKLEKILKENTQKEILAKELIRILSKDLLEEFSKKLKIKAKIEENAFDKWNLKYLPRLFTAEAGYKEEDKKLLRLIVKISFQEESFASVLLGQTKGEYTEEEKEWLEEIKKYNFRVQKEFEQNGLDFEQWLTYPEKKEFSVGSTKDQLEAKRKMFEKELINTVQELLGSYRKKKEGILSREEAIKVFNEVFKAHGIKFTEGGMVHSNKDKLSIDDLNKVLESFTEKIQKIYDQEKDENKKQKIGTALSHLQDLINRLPGLEEELLREGFELEIRLWQREPGYDIFQGNYTHCCVAVENFNRGAMLDYLIDSNLQVVEIIDKAADKTIAQTWLFVAKDDRGNLYLVLDNVEINSDYSSLEPQIRENLFNYLKEYTKAFGQGKIKGILLGASGYNDVETKELNSISLSLTKLAGSPRGTEYLDAFGSTWVDPSKKTLKSFFIVAENLDNKEDLNKGESKKEEIKIEIEEINQITPEIISQVNQLEQSMFPEALQTPAEDYLYKEGIHLILKRGNEVVGNLSAVKATEVPKLVDENHLNEETLYVWTIAIKTEASSLKTFFNLIKELAHKAKEKGIKKLVMHARVSNKLSEILQKRYGAKKIRRENNWLNSGEPFDYLEIDLSEEILKATTVGFGYL